MARLIEPSAYGLLAISNLVIQLGSHFSQMGIGPALIRTRVLTRAYVGTAYISATAIGLTFTIGGWLFAPVVARCLFDQPEVTPLVRVLSLSFLISAISSVSISLLRRDLRFLTIGIIEVSAFIVGGGFVGISLAVAGFGVWSLISSALCQSLFLSIFSLIALQNRGTLVFDKKVVKELITFGGTYSVVGFLEAVTSNIDVIFISHFLNNGLLGIYNRASLLIQLPAQQIYTVVNKVNYSSFSEAQENVDRLRGGYTSAFLFLGAVLFPFSWGVAIGAREIVLVVLGTKWVDAIPILRLLAIAAPFHLILHFHGLMYDVSARLNLKLVIRVSHLCFIAFLYYSLRQYGLIGFASAFLISEVLFCAIYTGYLSRVISMQWQKFLYCHFTIALVALFTCSPIALATATARYFNLATPLILAIEILTGAIAIFICFIIPPRQLCDEILSRFFSGSFEIPETGIIGKTIQWYKSQLLSGRTMF
jgi:O-antigen/teichoic acid export membrane protein